MFDATRCADETFSKPHPAMLQELTRELGQDMKRTVMIGDTTHDLLMANNAGAAGIARAIRRASARTSCDACSPLYSAESVVAAARVAERARLNERRCDICICDADALRGRRQGRALSGALPFGDDSHRLRRALRRQASMAT